MSNTSSLTSAQFKQAAELKEKIEALNQELSALLNGAAPAPVAVAEPAVVKAVKTRKKTKFTPEGLARLSAAHKARWAKIHAEQAAATEAVVVEPVKKKRKISKAGRAKIAAGARARWARFHAEKAAN